MPRPFAVIDAETDPFDGETFVKPFIWGFYDGLEFIKFKTTESLVEFLELYDGVIYAHNGGKFDYHFILEYLNPYAEINIISGRLAKFKIGLCEFRDSYNILPMPLSAYEKDEIDYTIMAKGERDKPKNKAEIEKYLEGDCIYLYDLIAGFKEEFGNKLTVAGSAMAYWEKITASKTPKSDRGYYENLSAYYYGGRVQCFKYGLFKKPLTVIDINSAYPYAMLHDHPYNLEYDVVTNKNDLKSESIINQSFYKVRCIAKGCFPLRGNDESLTFPSDYAMRTYWVTGWELCAAIDTNSVFGLQILSRIDFDYCRNFSDYILPFYERRLKAKRVQKDIDSTIDQIRAAKKEDIFCKLLMNSLYGKFGANPDNYSNYMVVPPDSVASMEAMKRGQEVGVDRYSFAGRLGPWALGSAELYEPQRRYYNIATAASITGFVRAYLFRAIKECHNVYYCDTDSIVCEKVGDSIKMGDELGEWDIEGVYNNNAIAGKKLYALINTEKMERGEDEKKWLKLASKGVRFTHDQVFEVASGKTVTYKPLAPSYSVYRSPEFVSRDIKMRVK